MRGQVVGKAGTAEGAIAQTQAQALIFLTPSLPCEHIQKHHLHIPLPPARTHTHILYFTGTSEVEELKLQAHILRLVSEGPLQIFCLNLFPTSKLFS